MDDLSSIRTELRIHDERIAANHDSLSKVRERVARQETATTVIATELKEAREDITEMKTAVETRFTRLEDKLETELSGMRKAVQGLIFTFASLTIGVAGVLLQALAS